MAFEVLINKPMPEDKLLAQIVAEIKANYSSYQELCFFLKLSKYSPRLSQIIWIKEFNNIYSLGDFYYDTKFERSCVLIKFQQGRYDALCHGFHWSNRIKIWPTRISAGRSIEITWNREEKEMISRELFERGFGEIISDLEVTNRNKAI